MKEIRVAQILFLAFAVSVVASLANAQTERPAVFAGPQVRGEFVDIDAGIRDSIRDVQVQAKLAGFQVAATEREATLVLIVLVRLCQIRS